MDMKKILAALDGVSERKPQGVDDMKRFVSIIKESTAPVKENIISGFEEGSVGGDANAFLIAADDINDLVMSQVDKIKINADEASLRDMMEKFNAFMTAYHNVGKGILQPDMFNDSLGESEKRMSRAAKGHEKYGKAGMAALAKAGREGAGEEKLDKIRDKHDKYNEGLSFLDYLNLAETKQKGLYYNVNKRKKAGTSRDADSPKAPTAQAWKDAAKTAKK